MTYPIEDYLGEVVTVPIRGEQTEVRLVDGEHVFDQPSLSAGFVHFANPTNSQECLGFGGANIVWDLVKDQL